MQTRLHPAVRQIAWLVVVIGLVATLIAAITLLFKLGPGIVLPLTTSPLDAGWLLIFGLLWLITGAFILVWMQPETGAVDDYNSRFAQHETRLTDLDKALQAIQTRLDTLERPANQTDPLRELTLELDNMGAAIQDMQRRLDDVRGVNAQIDDLKSQLEALYVTLQDVHYRIDSLEKPG